MEFLNDFHFLRPGWLLALLPALLFACLLYLHQTSGSNWRQVVDSELLKQLLDQAPLKRVGMAPWLLLLAWLLASLAMAGPVWRQLPQPVHEKEDALVILLDLSLSMYAEDLKPNRLTQARRKLHNLLEARKEGLTALIVYAGEAHTVTPLTDDTRTIQHLLGSLAPEIMPLPGSRLARALEQAAELFPEGNSSRDRILIVTDEITDRTESLKKIRDFRGRVAVSLLGAGSSQASAISLPTEYLGVSPGYLKDRQGRLILARLDEQALRDFAAEVNGRYHSISLLDDDLDYLLADAHLPGADTALTDREFDIWQEEGPWLLLLLLPVAALGFRRGWVWCLLLVWLPEAALASSWTDSWRSLWMTRNQQAQAEFNQAEFQKARDRFQDPGWKAAAAYRAEDFTLAAEHFGEAAGLNQAGQAELTSVYNLGNALAKQGRFAEAIAAYDAVLDAVPRHEDAAFNKALLEQLQQEQEQQDQQSGEQNQQEQEQGQNPEQQQSQNEQDSESEEAEQSEEGQQQEQQSGEEEQLAGGQEEPEDSEEQEALQQWLRRVPDDPGGLLKEKFRRQALTRRDEGSLPPAQEQPW